MSDTPKLTDSVEGDSVHRLVQRLLSMLDKADDLLSTGDVLLDGWPAAREWHAEYEKLSALAEKPSPVPLPTRELAAGEGAGHHEEKRRIPFLR